MNPLTPSSEDRPADSGPEADHARDLLAFLQRRFPQLVDHADLVQEAYLKLGHAKLRGKVNSERALLFTIGRNAALDRLRRKERNLVEPLPDNPESPVYLDEANAADIVTLDQDLEVLREALAALPERCRQILVLRRIHHLPHRDIAHRLGIAEHTVEKQVGIGLRKCLEFLRRRGVDPRRS